MADPIILELQAKTGQLDKKLDEIDKKLLKIDKDATKTGGDMSKSFDKSAKSAQKASKETKGLEKSVTQLGTRIAAAFAVSAIVDFTTEAVRLGSELKSVENAFQRVGNPQLLQGLRSATKGTVSDLELMKQAVKASNFKIPLEQLGSLFEFARRRAAETGESVEFLTQSIVNGIGRKSPLILDNLGISATELKDRLGGAAAASASIGDITRAVGEIAEESLSNMGDEVATASQEIDRLSTSFDNLKAAIGKALDEPVGAVAERMADDIADMAEVVGSDGVSSFEKLLFSIGKFIPNNAFTQSMVEINAKALVANETLKEQQRVIAGIGATMQEEIPDEAIAQKGIIEALKEQIKAYDELIPKQQTQEGINNLLDKREKAEERLNDVLNDRIDINKELKEEPLLDLDPSIFDTFDEKSESARLNRLQKNEEEATRIYEEELLKRAEDSDKAIQYRLSQEEKAALASQAIQRGTAALTTILQNQGVINAKEAGIITATINTALAVTQALGSAPPPASFALAAVAAALGAVEIAAIASQPTPSFYDGTDYLQLNGNKKGRDTIPVMAHEGEAIINATQNSRHKGLAKAWNEGRAEDWINANYVIPAINKSIEDNRRRKDVEMANLIGQNFFSNSTDPRIVSELKRSRKLQEEQLMVLSKRTRINRRRA